MATRHHIFWLGAAAAAGFIASSASADSTSPSPHSNRVSPVLVLPPVTQGCTAAAITDLVMPRFTTVDEVRVVLDSRSPVGGAAAITVQAGEFDRALTVFGGQSRALFFRPALRGNTFRVTLEPIFAAGAGACVDRIELRHAGRLVATVRP